MLTIEELSDRAEINDLVNRYGVGVAARDVDLLVSLFSADAELDYYGRPELKGAEQVRALFMGEIRPLDPTHEPMPFETHVVSVPIMTNILITLDGGFATCDSYCLATHAGLVPRGGKVVMRATRNLDRLVRSREGWKISHRRHELSWQAELPGEVGVAHR